MPNGFHDAIYLIHLSLLIHLSATGFKSIAQDENKQVLSVAILECCHDSMLWFLLDASFTIMLLQVGEIADRRMLAAMGKSLMLRIVGHSVFATFLQVAFLFPSPLSLIPVAQSRDDDFSRFFRTETLLISKARLVLVLCPLVVHWSPQRSTV